MCRRLKAGVLICEGFVLYITAVHHNHLKPCLKCVFSGDRTPYTLSTVGYNVRPEQETWTGTLEGGQGHLARVLFFILVLSLNISRPKASVNLEITRGAGWGHVWVGFDGFVHYNLLADATFSSRCAQRFYLLSSSCPQQIELKT